MAPGVGLQVTIEKQEVPGSIMEISSKLDQVSLYRNLIIPHFLIVQQNNANQPSLSSLAITHRAVRHKIWTLNISL